MPSSYPRVSRAFGRLPSPVRSGTRFSKPRVRALRRFAKHGAQRLDDARDLLGFDDQWRRHGDRISRLTHHDPALETLEENFEAARTGFARSRLEFHRTDQTVIAHVQH